MELSGCSLLIFSVLTLCSPSLWPSVFILSMWPSFRSPNLQTSVVGTWAVPPEEGGMVSLQVSAFCCVPAWQAVAWPCSGSGLMANRKLTPRFPLFSCFLVQMFGNSATLRHPQSFCYPRDPETMVSPHGILPQRSFLKICICILSYGLLVCHF